MEERPRMSANTLSSVQSEIFVNNPGQGHHATPSKLQSLSELHNTQARSDCAARVYASD
jgi:hypothetical protein